MAIKKNKLKNYGLGLGLRRNLRLETLEFIQNNDLIKWLEIVPENYIHKGGAPKEQFSQTLKTKIPLIPHGVNLSIGTAPESPGKPCYDEFLLSQLEELFQEIKPPWFSDHLSCTRMQGYYMQDLIPIPLTQETVNVVSDNVKYLQDRFQLPFLIENPSYYSTITEPELTELEFVNSILERADCGMLLDVNNIYVNSTNHGAYTPSEYLDGLNLDRVIQVHIAGHHEDYTAWLTGKKLQVLDTHGAEIKTEVYEILENLLKKTEIKAILLERDSNLPEFSELVKELEYIAVIASSAGASQSSHKTKNTRLDYGVPFDVANAPRNDDNLYQTQTEILNYFTGKAVDAKLLSEKTQEEMSIYKSLILSSLEGLIAKILPYTYKILENQWRKIIQNYYENFPSTSPIYNDAVRKFPDYLASEVFKDSFSYPNYLSELALYEWTSLETYNAPNDSKPKVLELKFPISQVTEYLRTTEDDISEIRETDIEEEDEFLLSFRDKKSQDSKFISLDRTSLFVVKALELTNDQEKIYIDFKKKFSDELKNQDESSLRNAFDSLVKTLNNNKILLES